ncbi:MAG: type II secretion system GspH family protein [Thermodesulfovibrionales bacterium]|nr:type II secretion system GspH family protein [Thermodesulfovibrionales bacterium]
MRYYKTHKILNNKGISLVEILIAMVIVGIITSALLTLYMSSDKVFRQTKVIADTKETAKLSLAQLEWLFQRWGTSTPCNDPTGNNVCTVIRDCRDTNNNYAYPPPSSICITILESSPCDEVQFYANLYGNGFVDRLDSATTVAMMSCRLSDASGQNCYHIKRGGPFRRDANNNLVVLIFSINNLSSNNLDCINVTGNSNATMGRQVSILNGFELDANNQPTNTLNLDGGDLLVRVPHRVRLFCQNNPNDNNTRWLYMSAVDSATQCAANENPEPLVPVDAFQVEQQGQGIRVSVTIRGPEGRQMPIQRFFGR